MLDKIISDYKRYNIGVYAKDEFKNKIGCNSNISFETASCAKLFILIEYYTNKNDNQIDILKGKPEVFSYSLTGDKIKVWNNKYIGLNKDDEDHFKSIKLMVKDDIIKKIKK